MKVDKYKDVFLSEAKGYLKTMNESLLELEKKPQDMELLNEVFRASHTLKGMTATMNYSETAGLCHAMEDVLDAIKKKRIKPENCVDVLFECFDILELTLKELGKGREELATDDLVKKLENLMLDKPEIPEVELAVKPETMEKIQSIEVKVERLDLLMNLAEELLVSKMGLERIKESLENPELSAAVDALGRLVTEVQYNVMQSRMVPIGFVFNRFPRMVRDLAKQEKKEVNLQMRGSEMELDRAVIDQIGEPLVHLLRNAVDHGIEVPEERKQAGKLPQGTIKLTASRVRGFAIVEVEDDGRGLDWREIKNTAIKRGILSEGATREELADSLFSGVSTTQQTTAVSGRGLGLNIVKKKVESLGGTVKVESGLGEGTKFALELPLSLAIIKTLFVEVGGKTYAIPLGNIERLVTANKEDIKGMINYEAIVLNEEDIPITRLNALFGVPPLSLEKLSIVIVRKGEEKLGLVVDAFVGTQEIVVKPLNRLVRENRYFAGSAIIGSGEVVLILDVANLILSKKIYQGSVTNVRD